MIATVARKEKHDSEPPLRTLAAAIPEIEPALVVINSEGWAYRTIEVRLPAGMTAADLSEPKIWRKVQGSRGALRKFDHLFVVAFDESWTAEVLVVAADGDKAVLGKPRIESIPERYQRLFEDETYRVIWTGAGYAVERKSDRQRMTAPVGSAVLAERDLVNLYPRRG
jgi:hypothetical protein